MTKQANQETLLREIIFNIINLLDKNREWFTHENDYVEFIFSIKSGIISNIIKNFIPNSDVKKFFENIDLTYEKHRDSIVKYIEFKQQHRRNLKNK